METARCLHCGTPIGDTGSAVNHGGEIYCCGNCADAMEQQGAGSDSRGSAHVGVMRCAHCGTAITDESTMRAMGNDAYCCENCYRMAA